MNKKNRFLIFGALILIFAFSFSVTTVFAQNSSFDTVEAKSTDIPDLNPELKIKLGNWGTQADFGTSWKDIKKCENGPCLQIDWISQYINALYDYGVPLAATLAVIMIMVGGFVWLTSGGSPDRAKRGKDFITSALAGLLIALFSFVMLNTLNPRLVNLDPIEVDLVQTQVSNRQTVSERTECAVIKKAGVAESCASLCAKAGLPGAPKGAVPIQDEAGEPTGGTCCACAGSECSAVTAGCSNDTECCKPLICRDASRFGSADPVGAAGGTVCLQPGRATEYCEHGSDCASGVCNTAGGNKCVKSGGDPEGANCSVSQPENCASNICAYDRPWKIGSIRIAKCAPKGGLLPGRYCNENSQCKSGLCDKGFLGRTNECQ